MSARVSSSVGDAIYDDVIYDQLPDSSVEDYLRTMERFLELSVSAVHSGHGDSFGQARMRAIARDYIGSSGIAEQSNNVVDPARVDRHVSDWRFRDLWSRLLFARSGSHNNPKE
ncbi:hypothetical protein I6F07_23765 [Ensifer sp. IC4062]|nr:hypothetical protein [Ensifer sp. IC4062]MCA1443185.1 hypothetical protein [Ensifer sp. IC4062]